MVPSGGFDFGAVNDDLAPVVQPASSELAHEDIHIPSRQQKGLYFGGSLKTRRNRYLAAHPATGVHLESGKDVVILRGESRELRSPGVPLALWLAEASRAEYGYGWKPEDCDKTPGLFEFRPRTVPAWKQFLKDATRWRLPWKK